VIEVVLHEDLLSDDHRHINTFRMGEVCQSSWRGSVSIAATCGSRPSVS
jgi:hypothetical protein